MTKARAHPGWMCPKPFSVANTTKRWCTRSWSPTRPTHVKAPAPRKTVGRSGTRPGSRSSKRARAMRAPACPPRRCGVGVAGFSRTCRTRISRTRSTRRCTAPACRRSSRSWPAKAGWRGAESIKLDSPKTRVLADKFKAMNLQSVMVIADEVDENLYLAARNLVNVLVVEPRYADPVSLVRFKKVLVTKGAIDKLQEMFA